MLFGAQIELLRGDEHLRRREQRPVGIAALHAIAGIDVAPEIGDRRRHVVVQGEGRALGQIVEQRGGGLEEQRQVVLDAGGRHAVGDVAVKALLRRIAFEQLAPAAAKARAAGIIERELARRQHADLVDRVDGALGVDVEGLDRIDHFIVEIQAIGQRAAHREQIDDAAAHADFAGRDHLRDVLVAGGGELDLELLEIELGARAQEEGAPRDVRRRAHPHQRGRRLVRRELVVGQRLPVRQQADAKLRREPGDFFGEALGVERGGGDHRDRMLFLREARERERVSGSGEPGMAPAGGE